jgi:3-phosphoshikimate 1-carboxyvinyltransferase
MVIEGVQSLLTSEPIEAHGDHRIVMGTAILALFAENDTRIEHADAVNKSFPEFFTYLEKLY